MVLSKAIYNAYLQFKCTFVQTLPSFNQLRRLELSSLPIDDELLKAIASHPGLDELRLVACSFPSPTFPISSIRLLEYNAIPNQELSAALRLVSPHHLQELRLEDMQTSALINALPSASAYMELHRLTIVLGEYNRFDLASTESLLCYVPALRQLDIVCDQHREGRPWVDQAEDDPYETRAFKTSTIPYLRRLSSPLSFARYVVPGRPVSHIQMGHSGDPGCGIRHFVSTWPELQSLLYPLCRSSASAEGITTLHLPNYNVAPIWLLSRFIAETFPRLIDLRLPVGLIESPSEETGLRFLCRLCRPLRLSDVEGPFQDGEIEGMVNDIRDSVEYQLVGKFEDPYHGSTKRDNRSGRVTSDHATATAESMPKPDVVAATLIELVADIELDDTGQPSVQPKGYKDALLYFAQGWYPLPPAIQTFSLRPGLFSPSSVNNVYVFRDRAEFVERETCMVFVTALGELYPSLSSVTLLGPAGFHCQRIGGTEKGSTTWVVTENDIDPYW